MQQQWQCTVCGYIHFGETPPAVCPVCGADASKFIPLVQPKQSLLREMLESFQAHAVAAHFPNALVPTALLFMFAGVLIAPLALSEATWYLLLVLVPTVPVCMLSGIYEWRTTFGGKTAVIFRRKLQYSAALLVLLLVTVVLRLQLGDPLLQGGLWMWGFFALLLAMLGCVTMLGHYGGKLVFSLMQRR